MSPFETVHFHGAKADFDQLLNDMFKRQEEITGHLLKSEDAREGATAFAEKRSPVWRAR